MRKSLPKVKITDEMRERQLKLRIFLKANKGIEFKEIRPIGFSISINTIPEDKVSEFLEIANSVKVS